MEALKLVDNQQFETKELRILKRLIDDGKTVKEIAEAIGKSRSTLSTYLNGSYRAPKDEGQHIEVALREYFEKLGLWEEFEAAAEAKPKDTLWIKNVKEIGVVETRNLQRIRGMMNLCRDECEIDILVSRPGLGKSFAIEQCRILYGDVVVIECDVDSTRKSLLVDIAESIGVGTSGSTEVIKKRIIKELRKNPRLLVFDEADLLNDVKTIEMIRRLHERVKTIGIMLVGNMRLAQRLLTYVVDDYDMSRISDRIKRCRPLEALTEEDTAVFLERVYATEAARKMLTDIGIKRGIRQLVNALDRLLEVTHGEKPITREMVEELGQVMLSMKI